MFINHCCINFMFCYYISGSSFFTNIFHFFIYHIIIPIVCEIKTYPRPTSFTLAKSLTLKVLAIHLNNIYMYIRLYHFMKNLSNTFFGLVNINKIIWFLCGSLKVRFADSMLSAYHSLLITGRKFKDTMRCAV